MEATSTLAVVAFRLDAGLPVLSFDTVTNRIYNRLRKDKLVNNAGSVVDGSSVTT